MASAGCGVVIDIDLDQQWLSSLRRRVEGARIRRHRHEEPRTIFRVPLHLREGDPVAYEPRIISLGPFWHDKPALKPMEQLKLRYVQRLLRRNPNAAFEDYVNLIRDLEVPSRACYSEDIDIESHEFVEMMLLEGCFFVEFLLILFYGEDNDPVLTTAWASVYITYDMLLLENQIPFFIIEGVFKLATFGESSSCLSLTRLLRRFFNDLLPCERMPLRQDTFYHVLHFVHSSIWPTRVSNDPFRTPETVPCATMLMEAGVKFREKKADSFLEVAFHNGTMEIPTLQLDDRTNSLFRNLIAFEQCFPEVGTHVVTYVRLLDLLIDSREDVALLRRHGCIMNWLGSDEEAARLFNRLCKNVAVYNDSGYLASVYKDVKKHCDSRWHKHRAKLMRDYFSKPWSFLSLMGALIIILLRIVQTSFAILAYFNPQPTSWSSF